MALVLVSPAMSAAPPGRGVWIVVPAYNEAPRLGATLTRVCARWPDVVVVDDGSTDATCDVALAHPVWLLRHPLNAGAGAATRTGIEFALSRGANVVVTLDADGQHDPADVERLIAPVLEGRADLTLGSRFLGTTVGMPASRRLLLRAAIWFTWLTAGVKLTDAHNGLRSFSRDAAIRIRITQSRMAHASEIIAQIRTLRLRCVEVPVTVTYTAGTLAKGQRSSGAFKIVLELVLGRIVR